MITTKLELRKEKLADALPLHEKIIEQRDKILSLNAKIRVLEERIMFSDVNTRELLEAAIGRERLIKMIRKSKDRYDRAKK